MKATRGELGWVTHIDSHEVLRKPGSVGRPIPGTVVKILPGRARSCPMVRRTRPRAQRGGSRLHHANNDEARRKLEHDGLWTLAMWAT
jgi:hypothetical protein